MDLQKENKMGTMPVGRLLISMSLPMIVSMLVRRVVAALGDGVTDAIK